MSFDSFVTFLLWYAGTSPAVETPSIFALRFKIALRPAVWSLHPFELHDKLGYERLRSHFVLDFYLLCSQCTLGSKSLRDYSLMPLVYIDVDLVLQQLEMMVSARWPFEEGLVTWKVFLIRTPKTSYLSLGCVLGRCHGQVSWIPRHCNRTNTPTDAR